MKTLSASLVLLVPTLSAGDAVDDLVRTEMKASKIPGLAIAVLKNGKPIKIKGYGYANLEHRVPVKPETIFQSGSVGKQFTATLVMKLVEEGKLKLSDDITKFFPEGKGKWEGVTVHHLLSHTSGLPDMPYGAMDMRKDYTEDELVKFLAGQDVPKKPGTEWRYNNGGYVLLGVLVGRVTGKFYGDVLKEKIFKPLGMTTARIISESDIVMNRAAGYYPAKTGHQNHPWVAPKLNTTADGSLYLSILDMAKWDAALYGQKILKTASLQRMWTPNVPTPKDRLNAALKDPKEGYGYGWMISRPKGHHLIAHGGAWQGFTSWIGRMVDKRTTVIVLCNLAGGPVEKIGSKVMQHYVPTLK